MLCPNFSPKHSLDVSLRVLLLLRGGERFAALFCAGFWDRLDMSLLVYVCIARALNDRSLRSGYVDMTLGYLKWTETALVEHDLG